MALFEPCHADSRVSIDAGSGPPNYGREETTVADRIDVDGLLVVDDVESTSWFEGLRGELPAEHERVCGAAI